MYDYWSQWRTHGTITEYLIKPWIRQREFCFNEMLVLICERSAALEIICKACAHTHAHLPSRGLLVLRDNHNDGSCQRDNYIATEAQRSVLHWMWERKKCYYSATSLFISATNQKKAFLKKKKKKKIIFEFSGPHFWIMDLPSPIIPGALWVGPRVSIHCGQVLDFQMLQFTSLGKIHKYINIREENGGKRSKNINGIYTELHHLVFFSFAENCCVCVYNIY